ncbi:hypothetical protein AVEN_60397-1 [Araneus ventricosus]|uniref:Uncharacterized protein n=1 Tax=Araneus ventricosus TaxID=182803 RepID=A0A4Y2JZM7_ARAVE|nr:hypothetical protein AVEN_268854-1 [Araneus ventricosus]GBM95019.1 hypothetical protein AVEN_60397-1 [Araneus ventricosus]
MERGCQYSGFESKDSDLSSDHHLARRNCEPACGNWRIYHQRGYMKTLNLELSLTLAFFFPGCLHPVAPVADVSASVSQSPRPYPNIYRRHTILF